MSIRHVEDLRRLKPIIAFIIDHFGEVAKEIVPLSTKISNAKNVGASGSSSNPVRVGLDKKPVSVESSTETIDGQRRQTDVFKPSGAPPGANLSVSLPTPLFGTLKEDPDTQDNANQNVRHSRMPSSIGSAVPPLLIPQEDEEFPSKLPRFDDVDSSGNNRKHLSEDGSSLSPRATTGYQHQYSSSEEWKILKALVEHRVDSFIKSNTVFDSLELEKSVPGANKRNPQVGSNTNNHKTTRGTRAFSDSGVSSDEHFEKGTDEELGNNDGDAMTITSDLSTSVHAPLVATSASVSSLVTPTDLDTISNNLQHVYIPSDRDGKRKQMEIDHESTYKHQNTVMYEGKFSESNRSSNDGGKESDMNGYISNSSSGGHFSRRRLMVNECRTLRKQISAFEEEWMKSHRRLPKGNERGAMAAVYSRYKDMKKWIRDGAATDIQKIIRRFLVRSKHLIESFKTKNANSSAITSSANAPSNFSVIPSEIQAKYQALMNEKKQLKRTLKKFDEDFASEHGRPPKKSDKEVMRPMYQNYHEVKAELESIRSSIEISHGYLPDDMKEDRGEDRKQGNSTISFNDGKRGANVGSLDSSQHLSTTLNSWSSGHVGYRIDTKDDRSDSDVSSSSVRNNFSSSGSNSLEALQEERKNLHAYLKTYERDFNKTHGRPVMKHEDIQPVAHEYERYKHVKALIRNMKQ